MKKLNIHYLQHVHFEGIGYIKDWAIKNNHNLTGTKFFNNDPLPGMNRFDWLIVMGGPMGAGDEKKFPWLKTEKAFIEQAIEAGKNVIGICLGAQIIASVLGSNVFPAAKKEIGWFPVHKTPEGQKHDLVSDLPENFTAFHWHGDTFELPGGAVNLIQTDSCVNQAFLFNDKVLAIQFHLEVTPESVGTLTENCRSELIPDDFVQTEPHILSQTSRCETSNNYLRSILTKLGG